MYEIFKLIICVEILLYIICKYCVFKDFIINTFHTFIPFYTILFNKMHYATIYEVCLLVTQEMIGTE